MIKLYLDNLFLKIGIDNLQKKQDYFIKRERRASDDDSDEEEEDIIQKIIGM